MSDGPKQSNQGGAESDAPRPDTSRPDAIPADGTAQAWGCQPSLEDIYRYMDGAMEPERQTMVQQHLGDCSGCDDYLHFHTGLQKLIGTRCQTELPLDLPDRVFKAITDKPLG